jgi:3',5'-cyclic AMP phosphodiesterase CpdA
MRVLHISDLHFGAHDEVLKESLSDLVIKLRPHVILVTGDLADQPKSDLLNEARDYLTGLAKHCEPSHADLPRLLVIPGNHDRRYRGTIPHNSKKYDASFRQIASSAYFEADNVWIYGFDSTQKRQFGANGEILSRDITDFIRAYDKLEQAHGQRFKNSYKIVALHHHPIPINLDSKASRWLTLLNAAEFLDAVLKKNINLILHGHEHIRARVAYVRYEPNRQLDYQQFQRPGHLERTVPILSIGSALMKLEELPGGSHNSCYLIEIKGVSEAEQSRPELLTSTVSYFEARGAKFDMDAMGEFELESPKHAAHRYFKSNREKRGFAYEDVASITMINGAGDAHRIVEYRGLVISAPGGSEIERSSLHQVDLPATSGYLDAFRAEQIPERASTGRGQALRVTEIGSTGQPRHKKQAAQLRIKFGRTLKPEEAFSYQFSWWAVNAFVMNTREGALKYMDRDWDGFEYTHYPVEDPVSALTVMVQFPDTVEVVPRAFFVRIAPISDLNREDESLNDRLFGRKALQYFESIRTATLRITNPVPGYSYGIKWAVPLPRGDRHDQSEAGVVDLSRRLASSSGIRRSAQMERFLRVVDGSVWRQSLELSDELLDVGLMVFDQQTGRMKMVASAWMEGQPRSFKLQDYSKLDFRYGEGIGGGR